MADMTHGTWDSRRVGPFRLTLARFYDPASKKNWHVRIEHQDVATQVRITSRVPMEQRWPSFSAGSEARSFFEDDEKFVQHVLGWPL